MPAPSLPQRYAIASLLGEGGQGRVYRVSDALRDRDLALKLVSASDAEFLRREFDTLRQIRHENLIQVFDWGTLDTGEAYYTMEVVEGEDWGQRMGTPQPAVDLRHILTGLLRGLAHLHCHGEIHGDLKPGNILLGQGGVVKVTDVGMGDGNEDGVAGTPGYTAPECWEGKSADVRSDLYAVGVMAYEALTGKHPFGGRTIREVVAGQMEGWVPSPGAHRVMVPADLERVVMRALEREAPLRQGSADEFMEGFGVEDRVGVILGGRFVDPHRLLPGLLKRVFRTRPDDPTLVSISGMPGSGKTELLEQLNLAYMSAGVRCVRLVAGSRVSFRQALTAELDGQEVRRAGSVGTPGELVERIRELASREPIAILLDSDAGREHADASEASMLGQLLYASSVERGDPIQAVFILAETAESDAAVFSVRTRIPDLDEAGAIDLAAGLLGKLEVTPGGSRALHQATGGNPSSLQAVLLDLISHGDLDRLEGRWKLAEVGRLGEGASPTLETRWRRRWHDLTQEQRDVLGSLALTSGLDGEGVASLERAMAFTGAVTGLQSSGWLRFGRHYTDLASGGLREVVLGFLEEAHRCALAGRLLDTGIVSKGPYFITLRLLARPSREALTAAIEVATAALKSRDLLQARTLLRECARHEKFLSKPRDRAELHLKLAEVYLETGDMARAERHARDESVNAVASYEASVHARAYWFLGTIQSRTGHLVEARRDLGQAMNSARVAGDSTIHLRALAAYAELSWTHGDDQERADAIALAEWALSEISATNDLQEERGRLVYSLGAAHTRVGNFEKAVSILEAELRRIASPYWNARVANVLGTACFYLGRYEEALSYYGNGMERLQDGDAPEVRARLYANRGACLNAMGRVREALDDNERSLVFSRRAGSGYDTVAATAGIAIDLHYLGRFDEALTKAREVQSLAAHLGNLVYEFKGFELEGFAALSIGDLDCVERVLQGVDRLPKDHDPVRTLPRIERVRAQLHIARGNRTEALESLRRAMELLEDENDLEDLWGVEIELAFLNQAEVGDGATTRALSAIAARARAVKNIVVEIQAVAAIAEILAQGGECDAELLRAMTLGLGRAEEAGFVEQAARISVGLGCALIDSGDLRAGQSRLVQAQRMLLQIASDLSPTSRHLFVRSSHVAPALDEIGRRLSSSPR